MAISKTIVEKLNNGGEEYIVKYIPLERSKEYFAVRNADGTFDIPTHDEYIKGVPYIGTFDNYREMDTYADKHVHEYPKGYVCHVDHNAPNAFVYQSAKCDWYIRLEEEA